MVKILRNKVTGARATKSHHCTSCDGMNKRNCKRKGHMAFCTAALDSGRQCGELFHVRVRGGCTLHPYSEGYNQEIRDEVVRRGMGQKGHLPYQGEDEEDEEDEEDDEEDDEEEDDNMENEHPENADVNLDNNPNAGDVNVDATNANGEGPAEDDDELEVPVYDYQRYQKPKYREKAPPREKTRTRQGKSQCGKAPTLKEYLNKNKKKDKDDDGSNTGARAHTK